MLSHCPSSAEGIPLPYCRARAMAAWAGRAVAPLVRMRRGALPLMAHPVALRPSESGRAGTPAPLSCSITRRDTCPTRRLKRRVSLWRGW